MSSLSDFLGRGGEKDSPAKGDNDDVKVELNFSSRPGVDQESRESFVEQLDQAELPAAWRSDEEQQRVEMISHAIDAVPFLMTERAPTTSEIFSGHPGNAPVPHGMGSGVIVDGSNGIVLTNFHVIAGAENIKISFGNELGNLLHELKPEDALRALEDNTRTARVLFFDPDLDLAVLKVVDPPKDLPSVPLGDSNNLMAGQTAIAIGNPLGLEGTVTRGIISSLERPFPVNEQGRVVDMIQVDAAINPGNSGGPLLDMDGRLIGLNTFKIMGPNGGTDGVGFAIPVNEIKAVLNDAIEKGILFGPKIGVGVDETPAGLVIRDVEPGGPADKAGIKGFDGRNWGKAFFLESVNGKEVETVKDLIKAMHEAEPGKGISFIFRIGPNGREYPAIIVPRRD